MMSLRLVALTIISMLSTTGCKDVAEGMAKKTVEATKETVKGLEDGIDEGRKSGSSSDDAMVVTKWDELKTASSVVVVSRITGANGQATIEFVVDNKGERPVRVADVEVVALDDEGFAKKAERIADMTVEPRAKGRLSATVAMAPTKVKTVRLWGTDIDVPADALATAPSASAPAAATP
ncbi:MAG: hypothetical protein AAGN82_15460 [Myxococcota bacterium]